MEKIRIKFEEHTADIKFVVQASSLDEVFRGAVQAISGYISKDKKVKPIKKKKIKVEAENVEGLLYGFLDELIFLLDAEDFVVADAQVSINDNDKIEAVIFGDDVKKYKGLSHVKAATYAEMHVKELKNKLWEAQFVMDV